MDEYLAKLSRTHPVVLFDGLCGFCDGSVRLLLKLDRERRLRYLPLQDPRAALIQQAVDGGPAFDSFLVVSGEKTWSEGRALVEVFHHIRSLRSLSGLLRRVPSSILDRLYRFVARNRYRIWRRLPACRIPDPQEKDLFL